MPGDLRIEKKSKKKKNQQTNKKRKVRSLMDFVIMENEIRTASKRVPRCPGCSKDGHSDIYQGPVFQTLDTAIHRINYYPADK